MPIESVAELVDLLRASPLLSAAQLEEVVRMQAGIAAPRELAQELLRRDWLTPFQINLLFDDKAAELTLGPYCLLRRQAQGSMAQIFLARHRHLGRLAAIKTLREDRLTDPAAQARLRRESQALAHLHHPNVVALYDTKEVGGQLFLVLEYVEGPTLAGLIKVRDFLPVEQAAQFIRQAALGLQHVHERGMVHRDVNPSNLVLAEADSLVKLVGFGLVRFDPPMTPEAMRANGVNQLSTEPLTLEGSILGTADYLAPEQWIDAHAVDARADLYGLGCTFYQLLTGRPPFAECSLQDKIVLHREARPTPVEELRLDLPIGIAAMVARLLGKEPAERYQTAAQLATDLEPFCRPQVASAIIPQTVLGSYQLLERLGETNMSQVFKARDLRLGRLVALKVVHEKLLSNPEALKRFQREVQAAARLQNPYVVLVYDADEIDGKHFLVMEYVEGPTLLKLVQERGPLPPGRACDFIWQAAMALDHVHGRGMVHRDVSPSNFVVTNGETLVKLLDLGLARFNEPGSNHDGEPPLKAGTVMGTPDFMAPEQWMTPGQVDHRADLYGLGCILYYLVTGRTPFPGKSLDQKLQGHLYEKPTPVAELQTRWPLDLSSVLEKMLAKEPEKRYQSAADVAVALLPFIQVDSLSQVPNIPGVRTTMAVRAVHKIKSPTAGTFYVRSSPDADPFVKVGSKVTPTTVVCIIEAMRIFNQITADCHGVITEVLAENQQPVEYGQVLFKVDLGAVQVGIPPTNPLPGTAHGPVAMAPPLPSEGAVVPSSIGTVHGAIAWMPPPLPPEAASVPYLPVMEQPDEGLKIPTLCNEEIMALPPPVPPAPQAPFARPTAFPTALPRLSGLGRFAGMVHRVWRRWRSGRVTAAQEADLVDCTVFAPPLARPASTILIQVFAHKPAEAASAAQMAQEFDATAQRRAFKSLETEIPRGSRLSFHLTLPGLAIADPWQHLVWWGQAQSVQFAVTIPHQFPPADVIGTVLVSREGVPIGHIKFKLTIGSTVDGDDSSRPVPRGESAQCYRKAFISYASRDRTEVLKRVQMLSSLRIRFFQDVLDLAPGDRWEQKLYRHIDDSDLFLLFWSSAAQQSQWVLEEVRYALKRKAGDHGALPEILPVILEGPPPPEPPQELAHLHFNDYLLYLMTGVKR